MCPNFSNRGGLGAKPLAKNCCQKHLNQCLSLDWPKLKCPVIVLESKSPSRGEDDSPAIYGIKGFGEKLRESDKTGFERLHRNI